ncbi:MAG: DUF3024 domain-containing protein [Actinomycetota bacterium]|nr:DUF3024 domain-containing protein [Actinomycetota bacterium]
MCDRCRKRWITCSRCGTGAPLKEGTLHEPLCARCLNPDPAFRKRCAVCQETWQLSAAECTRCSLGRKLQQIFTPPGGTPSPELDRLREALVRVDRPDLMLDWLNKAGVRRTLRAVAARRAITHEALDTLPPGRTLAHLRSMLVAAGVLPARDEGLTALERRISQAIAGRTDPGHRRALHGYAIWHHLRGLRRRLDGRPASRQQVKNVRDQVTAAAAFSDWLDTRGLTLATCTQAELDQWLAGSSGQLARSANFVRWAVARRLLHDDAYPAADRVAGLLILLYAQKLNVITALTTQHVLHQNGRTLLRLGSRPVVLPAPLEALVSALAATRKAPGSSLLNVPSSWLFPGRQPGSALTEGTLAKRLHALGISPRQSRSTALFTLAADLPAAMLAKTLGIHIKAAIQWQKISGGDYPGWPPTSAATRDTDKVPGLPELDIVRVRRWCEQRAPEHARDQVRVEWDIGPRQLTIVECRPPWREGTGPEWTRFPIARLRYTPATGVWTLYWRDRNLRFHRYDQLEPSPSIDDLLKEIDRDPTAIFWG